MYRHSRLISLTMFLFTSTYLSISGCAAKPSPPPQTFNAELQYLKAIKSAGPTNDPRLIF